MLKKSLIVVTPGDPEGIGPEITWKAIRQRFNHPGSIPLLCVGAKAPFQKLKAPIVEADPNEDIFQYPGSKKPFIWLMPTPETAPESRFLSGFQTGWAIEKATQLVLNKKAQALVTGPISKERLQRGGYPYPGHTEFLAHLCKTPHVTMMLANSTLRVSLVTTHVAIQRISQSLTREKIQRAVLQTVEGLRNFWKIQTPRIAVTALNPHGGEKGLFGKEEIEVIEPEIQSLRSTLKKTCQIEGPFPADTLFAQHFLTPPKKRYDAIVCMYHDQGLIPVKLLDFHKTVNVTLGLPIIRTSVDHGVGFDIVGKGIANSSSLSSAMDLATQLIQKKHRTNI
jgi:4-hydroxythreonine-4-phosphate dehydrogenase